MYGPSRKIWTFIHSFRKRRHFPDYAIDGGLPSRIQTHIILLRRKMHIHYTIGNGRGWTASNLHRLLYPLVFKTSAIPIMRTLLVMGIRFERISDWLTASCNAIIRPHMAARRLATKRTWRRN